MGRTGHGVRVIKLRDGDYVVGVGVCRPGATVLTVTEDGKGRRSLIDDYRITKRGGLGIRNYTRGGVAGIKIVDDTDDLILISQDGILIRMHANDINVQSRYGSGVRVMRLIGEDKVAVLARVDRDATAETAKPEDDGETDPTLKSWKPLPQPKPPKRLLRTPHRTLRARTKNNWSDEVPSLKEETEETLIQDKINKRAQRRVKNRGCAFYWGYLQEKAKRKR